MARRKKESKQSEGEIIQDGENVKIVEVPRYVNLDNKKIVMGNPLIEARYSLTTEEQKLVLLTIALVDKAETAENGFPLLRIPKRLVVETLDYNEHYSLIKENLVRLMSRIIKIEDVDEKGRRRFRLYQWFAKAEYREGDENIEVQFHPDLKPFLLGLKKNFTDFALMIILGLNSKYSIRLYQLLHQYKSTGYRVDYLEDLREKLGVEKNEYKRFEAFERRVLSPAVLEINEKTDLQVWYEKGKTGRKITHIIFHIDLKEEYKKINALPEKSEEKNRLKADNDLWRDVLHILLNKYNADEEFVRFLRIDCYAVYKTDRKPKEMIIETRNNPVRRTLRAILDKYWDKIEQIVKVITNGSYKPVIGKTLQDKF